MDDIIKLNVMESSSTLFEKAIPVRVTKLPGPEDRLMELTVRIVMGISKPHRSSKLLRVQLTNEADPFFLYFLEVSEEDFQSLKVEQCILVDFPTFPYKFIELLELCVDAGGHDRPRFQAILHVRTGDSTFSVVEANQFKHLSHLSLCFRQGNDSTIKAYLAHRLAEFKTVNADLHEKLRRTLLSLEKALRENDNLSSELAELRESNSRTISQLKTEYTLEIAHEKEKAFQEYNDTKEKFERERADLESGLRQQAEVQQDRLVELEKQVRTLVDSKYALEMKVAEVAMRLATTEKDLDERTQECERLRIENQSLDTDKQDSARLLNNHLDHLGALKQEVQDKSESVTSLTKQLEAHVSQRGALESSLKDAQAAAECAEDKCKVNEAEVNKCHQSIDKLQAELRTCKAKVKLKGQVASQQDNLLLERQTAIEKTSQDNAALKQEITAIKDDNHSLRKKADDLKIKLDEAQELQKSNQQMIQWLNQQLTDAQVGKFGSAGLSSRYVFRPNLSFLSRSDSTGRVMSNHVGPSFAGSGSLNGAYSCPAYKSMLRSSSPFGPSIHSKSNGSALSNGNISMLTSNSATMPEHINTSPFRTGHGTGKIYRPLQQLTLKANGAGNTNSTATATKVASGPDKSDCNSKLQDSAPWGSKSEETSWTILPRPPLSFVEARSELLSLSGKTQTNSFNKTCTGNGDDNSTSRDAVHTGNFSSASAARANNSGLA